MKAKSFRLDKNAICNLKAMADELKTDESKLVRLALNRFFADHLNGEIEKNLNTQKLLKEIHFVDGISSKFNTQNVPANEKSDTASGRFFVGGAESPKVMPEGMRQHSAGFSESLKTMPKACDSTQKILGGENDN